VFLMLAICLLACLPPDGAAAALTADLPVQTGDPVLDGAERVALEVISRDAYAGLHLASPSYNSPWIRDSYAWGMIPWAGTAATSLDSYAGSELRYWLARQGEDGSWITNLYSGYYDETPIFIAALADAYRQSGDLAALRSAVPHAERAWRWLAQTAVQPDRGSSYLLYAAIGPHVASDWADQVARRGYATGLEALWYHATKSMAFLETVLGRPRTAARYARYAAAIKREIDRLLWLVAPPHARNAQAIAGPVGHYTSWLGGTDYFELDSNLLCILYGIADSAQTSSILAFIDANASRLMGLGRGRAIPARTLYGDYEPTDYAQLHGQIADGAYQSGYWPTVGALAALAYARDGNTTVSAAILRRIAAFFVRYRDADEWYRADGSPGGASAYQWSARMYLVALYAAYLGIDERWRNSPAGERPHAVICAGAGSAKLTLGGRQYLVTVSSPQLGAHCSVAMQRVLGAA
jgi:glycogen debranching enzyme